jgi:hypothetical protein
VTWSTDRGPSKTNQRQLCTGNAGNRSTVRTLLSDRALVLGSRFPGLGKMVQEPRARFHVPEWRVFCYTERLRNRPPRLKLVLSDSTRLQLCGLHPPAASLGRQAHQPAATSELFPRACAACLPSFVLRFLNITVGQIRWGIPALHHYYYLLSLCTAILC